MVNEVRDRTVGNENGSDWAQENLGVPRIPYENAPAGLSTELLVMAFGVYMLVILTVIFEILGCCLLHHSQKWFGPNTKRYQVASGMSLAAPPWYKSRKEIESGESVRLKTDPASDDVSSIPEVPRVHLTAKEVVYEVDVPIVADEPTNQAADQDETNSGSPTRDDQVIDEEGNIPITAREYGQAGQGKAREWAIKHRLGEDALARSSQSSVLSSSTQSSPNLELSPPEPGRLRLLSGINASFEPGTLTALMGSSGAGKSTLLDVLAGYKTGGHISGDVRINGQPKTDATWTSIAGYCEQVDVHNMAMTVRESLVFAARLRLRPFSLPDEARLEFVTEILSLLDLGEFADMLVGDEAKGEGLPKHARKRLTVGVELAGNPSIIFADEPSSGLDSLSASLVVSCLQRIAKQRGLTVVCTIHQPSREVFAAFDNLLLLRKGGVCVFNGSIASVDAYMQSAPNGDRYAMSEELNPADFVLSVFCGPLGDGQDWGQLYQSSDMAKTVLSSFTDCTCVSCGSGEISVDRKPRSITSELWILAQREILSYWRTPTYMAVRFWWTLTANVIVGLVYLQSSEILNIIGAVFFYVNIATVPLMSAVVPLITARAVHYREVASGTYRKRVYGMAVQIAEVPFNLLFALLSSVIFYFMVGLQMEAERIGYFILMALASYWVLPTIGQLFAFLSPNIGAAIGTASLLMTLFTLTMGFLLPANEIPPWYIWLYWINPLRYIQQGLVVNEVGGDPVGDQLLSLLTWSFDDRWWYCYVAVILFGFAACVGVVAATRVSWLKR